MFISKVNKLLTHLKAIPVTQASLKTNRKYDYDKDEGCVMFDFFRKKTQLEQLIARDGIEQVTSRFAEIVSDKIPTREIAYQFILQELDGASRGNDASMRFASDSGIQPSEYRNALDKSYPQVDGPGGPQQLLMGLSLELVHDQAVMANFRCKVDDKIMRKFSLGKYASSDERIDNLIRRFES